VLGFLNRLRIAAAVLQQALLEQLLFIRFECSNFGMMVKAEIFPSSGKLPSKVISFP
jgi:hypothetical protein